MNRASVGGRAVVVGMDGTPYSFIIKQIEAGNLPHIAGLLTRGHLARMETEVPTVSSVAWASFMTGVNPGRHGIYGFTDRKPGSYELYFPNYSHLKSETLWEKLSREGKRCCVINVPSTYPARAVNGVLVSGFVAPNLQRATYPDEAFAYLQNQGYRIDVDAARARVSLDSFLEDLHATTEKRREAMLHFWRSEPWDLFMCVFTGTDRLHHFLWRHYEDNDPVYGAEFIRFYRRLDEIIGEFVSELPDDLPLFMLSDHGFCSLHRQVYINHLLRREGLLTLGSDAAVTIADMDPARTQAYCMDPGRVYINLRGREPGGIVNPGAEYEGLIERLTGMLAALRDPETGAEVVDFIRRGSELYEGPLVDLGPDLVVVPRRGYDFKGAILRESLMDVGPFTGMHTHDDAMLYTRGTSPEADGAAEATPFIRDVAAMIDGSIR